MKVPDQVDIDALAGPVDDCFALAGKKVRAIARRWDPGKGSPVFTKRGAYTSQGWTEWTQGFLYGMGILHFEGTGDTEMLDWGRQETARHMAPHVSHMGVHDHGFNNVSTYGNLRRLALEGRFGATQEELAFYELALKVSGAVQAARWSRTDDGTGFIHSFNGPHSLFVDTVRSVRSLVIADRLGHVLMGEGDRKISLLDRAIQHLRNTARYNVYYGDGRDAYDVRGRTAHEAIFNMADGQFRCPSSQQGYSPFSTWTRGLAWALLGFAEQLEFFARLDTPVVDAFCPKKDLMRQMRRAAEATADFFIANTPLDGIPYWDTGAPGLAKMGDYLARPSGDRQPARACGQLCGCDCGAGAVAAGRAPRAGEGGGEVLARGRAGRKDTAV
jgi:unsaturated chondroitin disaccharide hydrolase